jgi:hypothetical protein
MLFVTFADVAGHARRGGLSFTNRQPGRLLERRAELRTANKAPIKPHMLKPGPVASFAGGPDSALMRVARVQLRCAAAIGWRVAHAAFLIVVVLSRQFCG